jgi:hypothetical protein
VINNFIYDDQFYRTIPACIIDGRNGNPAVSGQIGNVIKAFCDAEVNKASQPGVLTYKMETISGNLAGVLTLQEVNGVVSVYQLWLRDAFKANLSEIQGDISIFITGRDWVFDSLI